MTVVALAGAKGSPGVTTAALALGAVWPRRVLLVECDPAGGDLSSRFLLNPTPGLLSLGSAARRQLAPADLWEHRQVLPGGLEVLLGPVTAEQGAALGHLWAEFPKALASLGADVLADCGRLQPGSPIQPLLRRADRVLLLARPTREGVAQLDNRLHTLSELGVRPLVVLLGERPYRPAEVAAALADRPGPDVEVLGALAADGRAAAQLRGDGGRARGLGRSLLIRSARMLVERLGLGPAIPLPAPPPTGASVRDATATHGAGAPSANGGSPVARTDL